MKDTAPISLGIIVVAGLFGLIAAGVAFVLYEFAIAAALFVGALIAVIAAVILMLGWRSPQAGPMGPRDVSPDANVAQRSGAAPAPTGTPVGARPVMSGLSAGGEAAVNTPDATTAAAAAPTAATATPAAPAQPSPSTATASDATVSQKPDDTGILEEPAATKPAAKKAAPKAKAAPAAATSASDDGKPELLSEAREGGPDNLKEIKGVGPKMEGMLHKMGVYHFDQVASWGPKEVAWVDENLEGFKGRVSRDNWVEQAKLLAAGGETEFSKKVGKGNVY